MSIVQVNTTDWQLIHQANGTLTIWDGSSHTSIGDFPHLKLVSGYILHMLEMAPHIKALCKWCSNNTTITRTGDDLTYNGLDIGV